MNKKLYFFILLFCPFILLSQEIYTPNKEFVFKVRYENNGVVKESYLSLWTQDSVWIYDNAQKQFFMLITKMQILKLKKLFLTIKQRKRDLLKQMKKSGFTLQEKIIFIFLNISPFRK